LRLAGGGKNLAGGGKNAVHRMYDKADRWMLALTRAWAMMPT